MPLKPCEVNEKRGRECLKAKKRLANNFEANSKLLWKELKMSSCSATSRVNRF